jgi:filamentous hemagglutinin
VGSVQGNVNINAGKAYTQTGSDVLTPQGDINITAQSVDINAATDTYANQQTMKYKQTGVTLSVSSGALNLAQNVAGTAQAALTSEGKTNKVLNALQTYANGSTLYNQGAAIASAVNAGNAQDAASAAGVRLNISIGASSAESSSSTNITAQQDSLIKAGGNVTIKASESDINVTGSQISADKNLTLDAAKNINLLAGTDTESNRSDNESSSASIGLSVGVSSDGVGFSVGLAASRGQGDANSDSITYNNTHVTAGETLTLNSGNDTNLIGANAEGKQVIANVGGDLNIQSLQDTATSQAEQSNTGISVSIPIGVGTGGGSISQSSQSSNSNYASVYEQSGIAAGEGGFNIKVQNNTDLKGAVITSTATPDNNQLTTGTLTTSNIQNHMDAEAETSGTTLGSDMLSSKYAAIKGLAGNLQNHGEENISDSSTTYSAISPATITITDSAQQQALTGKTAQETVATLNRDTANTNRVLAQPDMQALQDEVQQEQADRMLLNNTVIAFTDEAFRTAFLLKADIYKVQRNADGTATLDDNGNPVMVLLDDEDKKNLQPGANGKVNVYTNGIYNNADLAAAYAAQMGQPDAGDVYLVYFPEANNALSELLIAGYQKFMENSALGLTNSTQEIVNISQDYGASGLNLVGHSRGGMTIGNALESLNVEGNEYLLTNTNIQLYGSAYNAQDAANSLDKLNGESNTAQSSLSVQTHEYDFVGRILGNNPATGGTVSEGSSVLGEVLNTLTGDATVHNCYGTGNPGCDKKYPDKPTLNLVLPKSIEEVK